MEIPGVGGAGGGGVGLTSTHWNGNSKKVRRLRQKCSPRVVWIFWGTTQYE